MAYFVSHPIQYQAPLLRHIAAQPDIDLTVFFTADFSVRGYVDEGFLVNVEWDIPLLGGYRHEFLPKRLFKNAHPDHQISSGIARRLKHGGFDAAWIHGYHTFDAIQALVACRQVGVPVLIRAESHLQDRPRSAMRSRIKSTFLQVLARMIWGVLAIGKLNRKYWEHYAGKDLPIFDMPYAVDNEFFRCQAQKASLHREQLRSELGLESGRPVVLFASKLQERKRCIDLVEAFLRVTNSASFSRPPYLVIIGDGEQRAEIEQRVAGNRDIRMLGFRNQGELPRFYDLCDVFVLPSIHEPWGLVINEVMNAGRAVIVSDQVGCQPDLVCDGLNGYVFEALNVDALATVLSRALEAGEGLTSMGRESLRFIQNYSFEQDITGLRQALQAMMKTRNVTKSLRAAPVPGNEVSS
ncbi:Glycosyl transferase, group 1 [Acidisarcina polymorpha]|uniref:Glycosyl transferase, group 1 n=1 Tax=Acidisarcina polymorpha TaxID=2211140 RepID=A0A2Z5G2T8_9BACT|nr:Glycosyl transferase, group 1 [Acidisarcina polymorpha]